MANERLIDANALLLDNEKYFCEPCKAKGHDYHGVACRACWVDDMRISIEDAPTVDAVEVVHAHWTTLYTVDTWMGTSKIDCFVCSECGKSSKAKGNYCPNCGAKMDGDVND